MNVEVSCGVTPDGNRGQPWMKLLDTLGELLDLWDQGRWYEIVSLSIKIF